MGCATSKELGAVALGILHVILFRYAAWASCELVVGWSALDGWTELFTAFTFEM